MELTQKAIDRFWSHVDKSGDCWIWTGTKQSDGYGCLRIDHKSMVAHRVSYLITNGNIPNRMQVLHRCDNPPCVKPSHLFIGTQSDNMRDMVAKHRHSWQINPMLAIINSATRVMNPSRGDNHYMRLHPEKAKRLKGTGNPQSKLTEQQIHEIRSLHGISHKDIAARYGVSRSLIGQIISRRIWKHI